MSGTDTGAVPAARPPRDPHEYFPPDSNEYGRGVSFFDAVYGFSATLLIANLDAPPPEAWHSLDALADSGIGGQLFGFALSFAVIALFWRSNVAIQRSMTGLDGATITANLLAVALVMLIPFTTQGISDQASDEFALPTMLYALNIALASLAQSLVALIGRRRGLERAPKTGRDYALEMAAAAVTPLIFGLSIPIAYWFGPAAGQWTWLSLAFLLPVMRRYGT